MNNHSEWRLEWRSEWHYDCYLVMSRIDSVNDEQQIAIDDEANGDEKV